MDNCVTANRQPHTESDRRVMGRSAKGALLALVGPVVFNSLTLGLALGQVNQRPLSDFIDAQGTTACFTPPAPAQFGFSSDSDKPPVRFGVIDYTGLTAKYLLNYGINL